MAKKKIGDTRHLSEEIKDLVGTKLPIVLDVDGTVVKHHYPDLGEDVPYCVEVLKKWTDNGVGIIIDTMRSGKELDDAVEWFKKKGIPIYGIGKEPNQHKWTDSPKAYGILSVDDRNLGVPLISEEGERPYVDWKKIDEVYSEVILKMAKSYK